ncbi:MAG: RdgB/HAM1 family non-canonical purine NTP pyrophosphatase [Alphaproteobacteria bacterium]|jgi:XTP/dITP diphosphohydrolase|nr:RdgB/HAM1 family non-canonical purine NTP pyrophosphatase [Alphaproteobacteria bacterium]
MNRKINGHKLIIASHNQGKVSEIKDLLSRYEVDVSSSENFGMKEPEENGDSFEENALIKASETANFCGQIALSDDSGLCVDDLDGDPGIFSARWAGPKKDFLKASKDIEKKLIEIGSSNYSAYFICALAVCWPDGESRIFKGKINGNLNFPPKGNLGFGYDPIFIPRNYDITFGEMDPIIKHKISHRSVAFDLFSRELLVEKE